jgi:putative membrane protein
MSIDVLPDLNAFLNSLTTLLILSGFFAIRRKRISVHRACMVSAVITSALFLISYLTYHHFHGVTRFPGTGWVRPFYYALLGTHTMLAIAIVPLVLITLRRAVRGQFARHMKIARWTFPIWLYVSVTGVVVYLMLYHIYPSR